MAIGLGSVGATHWCTPFSRHVWFPPKADAPGYESNCPYAHDPAELSHTPDLGDKKQPDPTPTNHS